MSSTAPPKVTAETERLPIDKPAGGLSAIPLTRDELNAYILAHHRHHGRVVGYRYGVGAELRGELVGVAAIGRPRARLIEQYRIAEVTRVATAGGRNVCSFLYGLCAKICRLKPAGGETKP